MFKYDKVYVNIVKDKRIIAYKSEQIKNIAYGLREVLVKSTMKEWSRLGREKREKNKPQMERIRIEDERSVLYGALDASICRCPGCNQIKRNMIYNAPLKEWYCTLCVQEYRNFYHKNKAILDQGGFVGDFDEDFHKTFL
jgi:hypothetical protein